MAALSSDNGTVVFIDTNLDTHLALTVSDHDTVSDFKKRIVLEHPLCFPIIGQIQINGIKVKRNGHFYHLSDSMFVKSAFRSYNKSWFLSVDVSALEDCRQYEQLFSHASLHRVDSIGVANNALVRPSDDNAVILPCNYQLQLLENNQNEKEGEHVVSPCVSEYSAKKVDSNLKAVVDSSGHHDIEIPSPGSIPKMDGSGRLNNEVPSLHMECEVDGIDEGNKGDCNVYEDEPSVSVQSETIKQKKKRKREDTVEGDNSKEEIASDHPRVSEDTGKKAVKDLEMVQSLNIEEMVPSLNIERKAGELGNKDDCIRGEDVPSVTAPSAKRRKKSKKKKEDAAGDDNTKEETPFNRPHVSEHTEKEAVKNLEVVPSLHIECEVDGLGEENKGVAPSTSVPSEKKKGKSKRKNNKDTVGGSNSEINIGAVDNPVGCPSERASSFTIFQVPQSENKQDEKDEVPIDRPCISPLTEKKAVKDLEMVPNSHIECGIDGSNKGSKDESVVCEEGTSKPAPSAKKKKGKSKKKKEYAAEGDISNDNIASVDNPPGCPSERASNFNSFQTPQPKNKQDEKEEIPFDHPCVSQPSEKAVKNLEMVPNSHIVCDVDGSNKGGKDDSFVCEEGTSKPAPSAKKKSKKKKKKEDAAEGVISNDNIASVDNPPSCPSERASNFNSFQTPQPKSKQDEKEEIPFDRPSVSRPTEKEAVKNLEVVPSLHIECEVDGLGEENKGVKNLEMVPNSHIVCDVDGFNKGGKDDSFVCEEGTSKPAPSAKKKSKKKKKKEDAAEGVISNDNIASVDNPPSCPSERASNFNSFQTPQPKSKQDEKEEIPFDRPSVSQPTEKEAVKNLEVVPSLHIECEVDGLGEENKGVAPSTLVPSEKKKGKSKRKNNKDTVGGSNSEINIGAVDNPVGCPSERVSNFNSFQTPQPKSKQDEKEEIPFDHPSVSQPTEKEALKNLEMVPNSHIECDGDGPNKGSKDESIVCEEGTSKPALSSKKKRKNKSKRLKEDTVGGDISKDNIASVDNPPDRPSERASNFNSFQVPQSNNKQDEKEEIPFDRPCVSQPTEKEAAGNLKMASNSHIECEVDGSNKGSKDDSIVCEDGTSKPAPSAKKKKTNRRKKEETMQDDTMKENNVSVVVPAQQDIAVLANSSENANKDSVVPAQQDIVVLANSSENANKEVIKETDALKEHQNTAGTDKNSKNDVNVLSTNEASELMSPAKKKSRKRKKPLAHESKDIIMSETNLDKMDIGTDACKESMQSTTKGAENYKNQTDIELEVQLSDANEPKDLIENNENVVVGHCNQSEVGQIDGAAAGEVSPQNVDMNGIKEPVKPVKEKKGIKNAKSKGGGKTLRKDNGHVDASESETVVTKSLNAAICDPMPGNTEPKENPLNQTEGKVLQQEKMQGTVPSVTNKGDEFSTENIDSPEQTKTIPNAQNVDEHVSKKLKTISNNKQTSTPMGTSDMLTNGHALDSTRESVVNRIDKAPNAHKRGQVSKLSSPDSGMSSIGEYRKPPNNASGKSRDLEKQRKQIPTSNAKLGEGFNKMVQNKASKTSGNDAARVVSNSQQKKSLLDGAIFKDDSDSASEDEDKAYNSDASTRTPSDNSIPFDLDGYDSPDLNSQQNGSYDGKWLVNDERSSLKSSLSGTKKLPIEQILRSSARYKKAKITASQLDESETPPEFVPDSLA